jgi:hypothetical protein
LSEDDDEDSAYENGKKNNVISNSIKYGTKAAEFLAILTNDFDLTYTDVKPRLLSNEEAYRPHTLE